jgi:class 3 adenylate cyclase
MLFTEGQYVLAGCVSLTFTAMRFLLLTILVLFCFSGLAQEQRTFLFRKDSVGSQFPRWILVDGDKPEYASPAFDDHALPEVYPGWVRSRKDSVTRFHGIAWFRLHFRLDTGLARQAIAVRISHNGASELYLDGKKIYGRGKIGTAATSTYFDPQYYPVSLAITDTSTHLFALRYANWNYNSHSYLYHDEPFGFQFLVDIAQDAFDNHASNSDLTSVTCCTLFGIFIILMIIHGLLFLYYKADKSNLWFSIFSGSLALLSLMPFVSMSTSSPIVELVIDYDSFFVAAVACFALSGLLSQLFSRKRLRFTIMRVFYLAVVLTYIFVPSLRAHTIYPLAIVAMIEAFIVIVAAIVRKVPGARIIGAGLGLFILFVLGLMSAAMVLGGVHLQFSGIIGALGFLGVCLAVLCIPVSLSAFLARNFASVNKHLKAKLLQVEELSQRAREQEAEKQRILEHQNEALETEVAIRTSEVTRQKEEMERQHAALIEEKKKSDDLLLNILPAEVADELKQKGSSLARQYDQVSVLFTDIVDFTSLAETMDPQQLVHELNECFTAFDAIVERNGLEKIKTVGDAYMAVCGLPQSDSRHAQKTVQAAIEMRSLIDLRRGEQHTFEIRIGINSGPVVAGIVGVKKFAYDIWGDTVNTAARMEQHGEAGKINISSTTYMLVRDEFVCTPRGKVVAKNKGEVEMYFVETPIMEPA